MSTHLAMRFGCPGALALLLLAAPAAAEGRVERDLSLQPGGRLVVETAGGSITVTGGDRTGAHVVITARDEEALDRNANVEIDASTSGGTVSCDLPITSQGGMSRSSLRGTIGSGGPRLILRSSGGSILIGERSSEGV
jgi:hypothetical protein